MRVSNRRWQQADKADGGSPVKKTASWRSLWREPSQFTGKPSSWALPIGFMHASGDSSGHPGTRQLLHSRYGLHPAATRPAPQCLAAPFRVQDAT